MSLKKDPKILLMGNPNVGKSAIFSRLTGAKVTVSNYPGTTVGFCQGYVTLEKNTYAVVIDVPGVYSLDPLTTTDEVAIKMREKGDMIINVVDATNLERNLFLSLELAEKNAPMIIALNMWDETKHKGIEIDVKALQKELGILVVPVCGLTGFGIKELVEKLKLVKKRTFKATTREEKWEKIGRVINLTQKLHHHHHTLLERFEDMSTRPATGIPIAMLVVYLSFKIIRGIAENLITYVFNPLFDKIWLPIMEKLSLFLGQKGVLHNVIIGKLVNGEIDYEKSFGLLTTGLFVPIAEVLPYILSFYLILGILEDLGYLPRLATQVDNLMHRLGLHGYAIVPMILGLGCNVPGAMAIRLLETRREKFIAGTLMAIAIPCMAQIAMILGLVGKRGGKYVALIFGILFLLLIVKGLIMNKVLKGKSPEVLWEIPPYRMPQPTAVVKKLWMRVFEFMRDAVPYVLLGVLIINVLSAIHVFDFLTGLFSPIIHNLWGLPDDTMPAMLMGFLRKDIAIGMLAPLELTTKQLVITCTVLAIYFPCMATFIVLLRELGWKDMLKSAFLMILTAIIVGTLMNIIL
ncbi:MAG: ferrous iron transporter B [Candidatus Omnitrophica bacterium]|nr:ferrous iron transporter B [Candidatus Omnitrophota bacterium]